MGVIKEIFLLLWTFLCAVLEEIFYLLFTLFNLAVIFLSASVNYFALDWCRSAACDISEKPVCIICQ